MNLVENSELSRINALLDRFDASDRIFEVKLELLAFSAKRSEGSSRQQTYAEYFTYLMNHCFPDYTFSQLDMKHFNQVKNLGAVINDIDYNMSFIVERFMPGFAKEFWLLIKDIVPINEVDIYTYDSSGEDTPFNDGDCLHSFNYFFLDKRQQLVLFLCCVTTGKCNSNQELSDEQSFNAPCYQENASSCNEEDCLSELEIPETMT
ncbi:Repressor of RNA polymerase III transcription [Babesia sp. Xinjiang]|uniref:Repressor of RNA polymerase III transcription n=1 Tax=Babesia sp. Xinjiang TaxID=462227 RepID=UPI000A21CE8A|nr:Repressor of RNA polymerase III transcription [Babesia sp. Xinjiang]ORM40672.1 Repressor of RNA polymerase III transcription [Babesia sp. Xinjiang]